MARASGSSVENTFVRGLITEATGLNFPENAVTDADNVVFEKTGLVHRRLGIDLEGRWVAHDIEDLAPGAGPITDQELTGAVQTFLWKTVDEDGKTDILVIQLACQIVFFELANGNTSANLKDFTLDLMDYATYASSEVVGAAECSFAGGGGFLFIAHPWCRPLGIEYSSASDDITVKRIRIKVRDLEGFDDEDDPLGPSQRPKPHMTKQHRYNLKNQGWYAKGKIAGEKGND